MLKLSLLDQNLPLFRGVMRFSYMYIVKIFKIFLKGKALIFGLNYCPLDLYQDCSSYSPWVKTAPLAGIFFKFLIISFIGSTVTPPRVWVTQGQGLPHPWHVLILFFVVFLSVIRWTVTPPGVGVTPVIVLKFSLFFFHWLDNDTPGSWS